MNHDAVRNWLSVRRQLLERETAFTDLAIKVANGQESEIALQRERQTLESMRELCTAAYKKAFPQLGA